MFTLCDDILMALNVMIIVFWDVRTCTWVESYHHFKGICCLQFQYKSLPFYSEDGGSMFLQNVGYCLQDYSVSHNRRQ
jgi:hypothetical protein